MVTPSENEKGYRVSIVRCMMIDGNIMAGFFFFLSQDSSILYRASHLADVDYLLVHGTGDGRLSSIPLHPLFITSLCRQCSLPEHCPVSGGSH